jgi:hypothetical protein
VNTAVVWVLLAMSIDPLKPECPHQRVSAAYVSQEACDTIAKAMRSSGADTVWECAKVRLIK